MTVQHDFFYTSLQNAFNSLESTHVAVLLNMPFPKSYYINVYKCGQACRQHALYEDQMLSQSRKENEGIQSHHCLQHFAFSIHGNLALWGFLSSHVHTVCYMQRIGLFFLSFCGCGSILRVVFV